MTRLEQLDQQEALMAGIRELRPDWVPGWFVANCFAGEIAVVVAVWVNGAPGARWKTIYRGPNPDALAGVKLLDPMVYMGPPEIGVVLKVLDPIAEVGQASFLKGTLAIRAAKAK